MTLDSKSSMLNIDCQMTFAPAGILLWVKKFCPQVGGSPTKEAVYSSDTLVATQVMASIFGDRARSNHMKGRGICV
jgi:hypothetical protein